jgi:hypothetical protein
VKFFAFLAALLVAAGAHAQPGKKFDNKRRMSQEERREMREQMREAYRDRPERFGRHERHRQMSDEEREKLRRDIQDANRDLRRR